MKKPYLCHISQDDGTYVVREFDGIIAIKNFLRGEKVRFSNYIFSNIDNDSIILTNHHGTTYEIEMLLDTPTIQDGIKFLSCNEYIHKYNKCKKTIYSAIKDGRLRSIKLGCSTFIEDKPLIRLDKFKKATK